MSLRAYIKQHRTEIDAYIALRIGTEKPPFRVNDRERELWIRNDETLFYAARAAGVRL